MSTAIDTNILVDLLAGDDAHSREAVRALDTLHRRGGLVICGVVYAELLAYPDRTDDDVVAVVQAAGIRVDWDLGQSVWRSAGLAYAQYVSRRRQAETVALRRILADFVIGADAAGVGSLLTRDLAIYRASFPELAVWGTGDVTDVAPGRTPEGAPSCVCQHSPRQTSPCARGTSVPTEARQNSYPDSKGIESLGDEGSRPLGPERDSPRDLSDSHGARTLRPRWRAVSGEYNEWTRRLAAAAEAHPDRLSPLGGAPAGQPGDARRAHCRVH